MYITLFILFAIPLFSSLSIYLIPTLSNRLYRILLVFGGSYLFSFMLVHMLPELFALTTNTYQTIGLYLLAGFFLQILLDYFSGGIAHGHIDTVQSNSLHLTKTISLLIALCTHALLDGLLLNLSIPNPLHPHHGSSLLLGILLHKIPIAITLAIVLSRTSYKPTTIFTTLLLFAASSPAGWLLAHYFQAHNILSHQALDLIRAMASGSLLHIVTIILFEADPYHKLNTQKLFAILAGGIMAIMM